MPVFTVIDHTETTGVTAYFEETGISGAYDHLYCVASVRSDSASPTDSIGLWLNGETSNFYSTTNLYDNSGTGPSSGRQSTGSAAWEQAFVDAQITGNTATADTFGFIQFWIPNYAGTTGFKQVILTGGAPNYGVTTDGDWRLRMIGGLFHSTSAITEIKFAPYNLTNEWMEFSTFTLYGVKGA